MPLAVGPVVVGSALAAGAILRATEQEALLSGPEYIKDAEPEGLTKRIGLGLARQACRRYAVSPGVIDPTAAARYENACRPYLDSVGYGSGPSIEQPYSGGQCQGVRYILTYEYNTVLANGQLVEPPSVDSAVITGPILAVRGAGSPEFQRIEVVRGNGIGTLKSGSCPQGCYKNIRVVSVVREDGLPDDCGSPPPDITQPEPPDSPGPVFEPIVIIPTVNIDAGVTVNIDGTVEIQIGDDVVEIDPFGGDGGGGDGGGDGGGNPPGAPEGGPVLPGGNGGFGGDDELGEPPAGKRWVGVCMAITQRPEGFGTVPTNTADKVYPEVVGNVRLICNAAGTEIVNTPVQIRSDRICLWEPVRGLNPVAIRVNLRSGFGYSYQGYAQPIDN